MSLPLLHWPGDILLELCKFLAPEDLFSLDLTCRSLHELLSSNDTIWHQASSKWPLDIPAGKKLTDIHGLDLRRLFHKALALDKKWAGVEPLMSVKVTKRPYSESIIHLQMLTSQWLLAVVSKSDHSMAYALWSLQDLGNIRTVLSLDISRSKCLGFSASWQDSGEEIIAASYNSNNSILVHSMMLREGTWHGRKILELLNVTGGVSIEGECNIQVVQHLVVICTTASSAKRVWLINTKTKRCFSARIPAFDSDSSDIPVARIGSDLTCLVLVAACYNAEQSRADIVVHVYSLPPEVLETTVVSTECTRVAQESLELCAAMVYVSPHLEDPSVRFNSACRRTVSLDAWNTLSVFLTHFPHGPGLRVVRLHVGETISVLADESVGLMHDCWNSSPYMLCLTEYRGFFLGFWKLETDHRQPKLYRVSNGMVGDVRFEGMGRPPSQYCFDEASGRMCGLITRGHGFGSENGLVVVDFI